MVSLFLMPSGTPQSFWAEHLGITCTANLCPTLYSRSSDQLAKSDLALLPWLANSV
jgi:hypothetical protein